jgi:hypothetical protein
VRATRDLLATGHARKRGRFETREFDWVISKNLQRRNLDESQRAYVAVQVETLKNGQRADLVAGKLGKFAKVIVIDRKAAAILLNVSYRSITSAAVVRDHGSDELKHEVQQGHIPISLAAKAAREAEMPLAREMTQKCIIKAARVARRSGDGKNGRSATLVKARPGKEAEMPLKAKALRIARKAASILMNEPFQPTEVFAIYEAAGPVEIAAAKARMVEGKKAKPGDNFTQGKTRDKVGKFAGVSGKTLLAGEKLLEASSRNEIVDAHRHC